jgi:hypothetical protein
VSNLLLFTVRRLQWSVKRRQRGHETLGQFALSMRLLVGKALRRLGRLEEAELAFKVLAGKPAAHVPSSRLLWLTRHGGMCVLNKVLGPSASKWVGFWVRLLLVVTSLASMLSQQVVDAS